MPLTNEELAAIESRAEAATHVKAESVRWAASGTKVGYFDGGCRFTVVECSSWEGPRVDVPVAEFIAYARSDVPRLIADLRTARDRIKELEANQIVREYDEETGYCLCPCCRHGI